MPLSQSLKCERTQRTRPPQRRYWPRKKQRSVNQAGRKKRCPGLAGKATSRGRKTRTSKKKLSPAETASAYRFMGMALYPGLFRPLRRLGSGGRLSALCVELDEVSINGRFGSVEGSWRRLLGGGF